MVRNMTSFETAEFTFTYHKTGKAVSAVEMVVNSVRRHHSVHYHPDCGSFLWRRNVHHDYAGG